MTMDFRQYRLMDLLMLSVLAAVMQFLGTYLHNTLPGAGFYLNLAVLITIIALFRWGIWGSVVLVIAGIPMVFFGENSIAINLLMYMVAPAIVSASAVLLKKVDPEGVRDDLLKLLGFTVATFLLLAVGQGIVFLLIEKRPLALAITYFLANSFNMVITYVVLLIVRQRPGLMIDMKTYFEREQNKHEFSS